MDAILATGHDSVEVCAANKNSFCTARNRAINILSTENPTIDIDIKILANRRYYLRKKLERNWLIG